MSYQINEDNENKLVVDGEYVHYSIPVSPPPRGCTTYTLMCYLRKMYVLVHFVKHVLPDHLHRPLDITVIPKKFDPNEIEEGKFLGIITKYRPKNFLHDLRVQHAKNDSIIGRGTWRTIYDEFIDELRKQEENGNER